MTDTEPRKMPRHATRPEPPSGDPVPVIPPAKQLPHAIGGSRKIEQQSRRKRARPAPAETEE